MSNEPSEEAGERPVSEAPNAKFSTEGWRYPIGLPHPLVQDDRLPGPRRLSDAEMEEIERLIHRMRRRSDPINLVLYLLFYGIIVAFWTFRPLAPGLLTIPIVLGFSAYGYRVWEHVKFARLRKELDRAREARQVIGFPQGDKHYEVLGPRILWTIDGQPSSFRTHGPL